MPLKTVLDDIEGVDDAVKPFYIEKDGKFVLDAEGVDDHPEVANLKNAYQRVKEDRESVRQEMAKLRQTIDGLPEDFDAEKWEELKAGKAKTADPQELVRLRETLERERDEWKSKFEDREKELTRTQVRDALNRALGDAGVPETLRNGARLEMLERVTPQFGNGGVVVETDMGPMDIGEYAKRWVAKDGAAYVAKGQGGGATGGRAPGGNTDANPFAKETFNLTMQGQIIKSDRTRAERMMRAAGMSDAQVKSRLG